MPEFRKSLHVDAPRDAVFSWHTRPGAFQRLAPPWAPVRVIETTGRPPQEGARVRLQVQVGPVGLPWTAVHGPCIDGERFIDTQTSGPFARWEHTHHFETVDERTTRLEDAIEYALPLGHLGRLGHRYAAREIARLFAYRHRITAADLASHQRYNQNPLRIAMTGSTGLLGSALTSFLRSGNHQVIRLRHQPDSKGDGVPRDPHTGTWPAEAFEGVDAVIHLAGENIASGRWTATRKNRIRESRVAVTRQLSSALASLPSPPTTLITASAIGWYGDRDAEVVDERSPAGQGFLPEVCQDWEHATTPASASGIRVAHLRLGVVLTPAGGALKQMLRPFQAGLGGPLGSGHQYMSWIALDDVLVSVSHVLAHPDIHGPVNVVAPSPVTNKEFADTLGRVLRRPALLGVPAVAMRLLLGEMADTLLLTGAHVQPTVLTASKFDFTYPHLESALRHLLGHTELSQNAR